MLKVLEDFPLSHLSYYRIGGNATKVFEVHSPQEVKEAITLCKQSNITSILVLGLGSNIIIPDEGFSGAVIKMNGQGDSFNFSDNKVKVFAGETMDVVIKKSLSESLTGLEWAGGLPSSVGGAVRGNAGAFGSETKDTFFELEALDLNNLELGFQVFTKEQAQFSYRDSFFKHNPQFIITSVTFSLRQATTEQIKIAEEIYKNNIAYRSANHPMNYPSCGSVFKNITEREKVEKILAIWPDIKEVSQSKWHNKISMGFVISKLGFSGKKIGGAMVSPQHTNYIINIEHAKADDIKMLISEIQTKFESTFGFVPEPEVVIL